MPRVKVPISNAAPASVEPKPQPDPPVVASDSSPAPSPVPAPAVPAPSPAIPPVGTVAKPQSPVEPSSPRISRQQWLFAGVGLLVIILLATIVHLNSSRSQLQSKLNKVTPVKTASSVAQETKSITAQIGQTYTLPTGETPTLVTVTDINKAKTKDKLFFNDAQNGDKLLLYSKAGVAIIYRPSTKKIINVARINPDNTSGSGQTNGAAGTPTTP